MNTIKLVTKVVFSFSIVRTTLLKLLISHDEFSMNNDREDFKKAFPNEYLFDLCFEVFFLQYTRQYLRYETRNTSAQGW